MLVELQPQFDEVLQPFGNHAVEFFLAASLYHARKISFASAAHIAGLSFDAFRYRLEEHFNQGFLMADECVLEDFATVDNLVL
jgi:predicted HTH domain antitoxin